MDKNLWQYVMSVNPFTREEDVESIEWISDWDLLITYTDGTRVTVDTHLGTHQNVFYDDIDELTDEQERKHLAYRIRSLMGRRGYTQETLAEAVSITQAMLSRYMTGESVPSAMILRRMAKVLNYSMDEFFYKNH
jgi:DNA-binding XRE family transcriptional regulator